MTDPYSYTLTSDVVIAIDPSVTFGQTIIIYGLLCLLAVLVIGLLLKLIYRR